MLFIKYIKTVSILLVLQSFLLSQGINISGKILDIETQKPISNVNIFIKDKDIGTTSDSDGYFLLLLKNNNQKKITYSLLDTWTSF